MKQMSPIHVDTYFKTMNKYYSCTVIQSVYSYSTLLWPKTKTLYISTLKKK